MGILFDRKRTLSGMVAIGIIDLNKKVVYERFQAEFPDLSLDDVHSWDLRNVFLTKIIGTLAPNEPKFDSPDIQRFVAAQFNCSPYRNNCQVEPFSSDGPMILITGRVSPQKGIENIFYTFQYVILKFPNVRFIFLLMPTPYQLEDLKNYMQVARKYPKNVPDDLWVSGQYLSISISISRYLLLSEPMGTFWNYSTGRYGI